METPLPQPQGLRRLFSPQVLVGALRDIVSRFTLTLYSLRLDTLFTASSSFSLPQSASPTSPRQPLSEALALGTPHAGVVSVGRVFRQEEVHGHSPHAVGYGSRGKLHRGCITHSSAQFSPTSRLCLCSGSLCRGYRLHPHRWGTTYEPPLAVHHEGGCVARSHLVHTDCALHSTANHQHNALRTLRNIRA